MNKKALTLFTFLTLLSMVIAACAPAATPAATTAPVATQPSPATQAPVATQPGSPTQAAATQPAATRAAGAKSKVEIFSWWVGPGEADGLACHGEGLQQKYPNIEFVNAAVAGGAGTNARAVLATRLSADDPPDSWQAHAGQEIIGTYVAAEPGCAAG